MSCFPAWPPSLVAIVTPVAEKLYAELCDRIRQFGDRLVAAGVEPGARVVIAHEHSGLVLRAMLACWHIGAVPCPLNPKWSEAQRIEAATTVGARWIDVDLLRGGALPSGNYMPLSFGADPNEWALIVHTSGSSGPPKPAVLSWGNLLVGAENANARIPMWADDRWLLSLPLYHVGGIGVVVRCMTSGATIAMPNPGDSLAESLVALQPTHVSLVATQLYRLLQDSEATQALARCKAVVMGGGPMPARLVDQALSRAIPLVASYGMTETAAMIAATAPDDPRQALFTSGSPFESDALSITGDGEIRVRGGQLFQGYLQHDGALDRPLDDDGWFRTGDLGELDEQGYLHVTGRKDHMFISGGENIQPEVIEQAIREIDGVREALVVPVEDAEWGQKAVAFVDVDDEIRARLTQVLRDRVAGYQVPKTFHPWPEDLVQPGIKPSRVEFRERAKELER